MKKKASFISVDDWDSRKKLKDNVNYINDIYRELSSSMGTAETYNLDESIREDVQSQLDYLVSIVKPYDVKNIYCNYLDFDQRYSDIRKRMLEANDKYERKLKDLGFDKRLYEDENAKDFFKPACTVEEFIDYLVEVYINTSDISNKLRDELSYIYIRENPGKGYDKEQLRLVVRDVVYVIERYHQLWNNLTNKNVSFAKNILDGDEIPSITNEFVEGNHTREMFERINAKNIETDRIFSSVSRKISGDLRTALDREGWNGEVFNSLVEHYNEFINGEEFVLPENPERQELEKELYELTVEYNKFYNVILSSCEALGKSDAKDKKDASKEVVRPTLRKALGWLRRL